MDYIKKKTSRNNMIQVFRALSIIAVVMIHTTPYGMWQVYCRPFINFSVATFLFLSGYLTNIENDNWSYFYKKRITRVIIPYIIWTIIYTLPYIYSGGNAFSIIKNLITARVTGHMYYIFVYIQFVLLTPLLSRLAKSKYRNFGWFIAPISVFIFKYSTLFGEFKLNPYISLFWNDACLGWFTYYYLGLLLGNRIIKPKYSLKSLICLYLISIVLQIFEGYIWFLHGEQNCGTQLKITSFLTSTIFLLIIYNILNYSKIEVKSKFIKLLGDHSFGIYLCHIMIMMILGRISYYTYIPYPLNSFIVIIVSFVFCYFGNKILGNKISLWLGLR